MTPPTCSIRPHDHDATPTPLTDRGRPLCIDPRLPHLSPHSTSNHDPKCLAHRCIGDAGHGPGGRAGTLGAAVLSVSKLGAGQEGYYLDSVAQGVEDYYFGHGETPGRWMGSAAALLGLDGEVDAPDLRAVLEGRSPVDGTRLIQARKDRVPGFDLTFSAPKSVSVLFGLGDPDTVRAVRTAHDRSVDAALGWLEREACLSRRGVDGVEHIAGEGFVAAGFVHRSSRAGDPQLHTHVLVANLTRCDDSVWRTLHGGPLLWQARTAGYLYKAQLRHELTVSLGVAWGPVHKGAAEIIGIPAELCALFSTRRHEIQDELDARGEHSPRAARVAALETRQAKDYGVDIGALRDRWHDQALEAGHAPETITAIGRPNPPRSPPASNTTRPSGCWVLTV